MCQICRNENVPNITSIDGYKCTMDIIPNIGTLLYITLINCKEIKYIYGENVLSIVCIGCPLLCYIPNNHKLRCLRVPDCPNLMYLPLMEDKKNLSYNKELLKLPFENCKYLTSTKMNQLYKNIYKLWKKFRIQRYILIQKKINNDDITKEIFKFL